MTKCCKCKVEKEEDCFPWKNRQEGIRQPYCKPCKSEYNKKWYSNKENRQNQIDRAAKNKKIYILKYIEWKSNYVIDNGGCSYEGCKIDNPIMIDFDHLDRSKKFMDIGQMVRRGVPLGKVKKEAEKCRLLCANHHRLHTAEQMGWLAFVSPLPPKE